MRCLYLTSSSPYSPWRHLDFWSCSGKRFTKTVVCTRFIATPKLKLQTKQRSRTLPNPLESDPRTATGLGRTPSLSGSRPFHEVLKVTQFLGQLDLKNVQPVLDIAAESFSCGHLSGDLDALLVPRARGGGDGAAACLGMNRTIFLSRMK